MTEARRLTKFMPFNPDYARDPDAMLRELREQCPISRDVVAKTFILTRYDDVRGVLNDRTLWRGPEKAEPSAGLGKLIQDTFRPDPQTGELRSLSIVQMDDPDHSRVRAPLSKALFSRVAKSRPLIDALVGEILLSLQGRDRFDALEHFAIPIPIDVIGAILGVDRHRRDEFREWSEGAVLYLKPARTPQEEARRQASSAALDGYFSELMSARRATPRDDLVTDFVRLKDEGADLSDEEIRSNLTVLLAAGNLTTSDLIGNGIHLLLTHPDELAKFKADPGLASVLVEEILRYAPPNDVAVRIASRDMEVAGVPVAATQSMTCLLRAANRDPGQYVDPDRFDITRPRKPHLTFGGGAHFCVGAPLARAEAQSAFTLLFRQFPNLRLANPGETPPKRTLPFLNGFERLDVLV